ncbi:sigma-70 family RNA polymerase sigma factor [Tenacibaculum sp. HL-MS23]|uniref:RNA polymerase sigma factor n=1 Tax=Tenacibaculum sp. HL-MS23 TaxID=3077734 RepID=UPI0028FC30E9|nr:sigma-70 family RNA polymerase sigma factor [Tenacibaculum sp. HL-MS23]WNW02120.1 sigma-70 family RNA polymerase sigma factor [Tenacibaculum sp. HL-MS23]
MKSTKQLHQSIINACKNNDAKAQMQLYDLYCEAMLTVANRYVKDTFIAEDIMQEAFIKAFKNMKMYKEEVAFGAWLKRIVINQSIDWLKKKKLEFVAINEETTKITADDNWEVETVISYQEIINCIQKLKDKYSVVLTLFLLEGYDHGEISEILGISESTSRTHLLRGKKKVQEQLKAVYNV